jgi:hypothetical protein
MNKNGGFAEKKERNHEITLPTALTSGASSNHGPV